MSQDRIPLTELHAAFIKRSGTGWRTDATFADCDGVSFLCPLCYLANFGPVGTHSIICWKPHVPQDVRPGPGRWNHQGSGLPDLSLRAGSSSIFLMQSGCRWHGFVENGMAHTDLGSERVNEVRAMYRCAPINVRDFGAVDDGVTDNTEAIQKAFSLSLSPESPMTEPTTDETPEQPEQSAHEKRLEAPKVASPPAGFVKSGIQHFFNGILHDFWVSAHPGESDQAWVPVTGQTEDVKGNGQRE